MSKENVQTIIGRAISEPEFRTLLFNEPAKALAGYELTDEEAQSLKSLDQEKFDLAANQVDERISKSGLGIPGLKSAILCGPSCTPTAIRK
jgi:hypothetical protein